MIGANINASGTATYLGLWTATGTVHFTPDPSNPGRLLSNASLTFVAADGDKLQIMLNGNLDPAAGADMGVVQLWEGLAGLPAPAVSASFW